MKFYKGIMYVLPTLLVMMGNSTNATAQIDTNQRARHLTLGMNVGGFGFSPHNLEQVSGTDHLDREGKLFDPPSLRLVYDNFNNERTIIAGDNSIGFQMGYMFRKANKTAYTHLQLEFQRNTCYYSYKTPFIWVKNNESWGGFVFLDKYLKYGFSVERGGLIGTSATYGNAIYGYIRQGFGQAFNHWGVLDGEMVVGYYEDGLENGTGARLDRIEVNGSSLMSTSEIGLRFITSDRMHSLNLGMIYYYPFKKSFTDQYEFFQNSVSTGVNRVEQRGASLMVNVSYSFNYQLKEKAIRIDSATVVPDVFAQQSDLGRKLDLQHSLKSSRKSIKIKVWDRGEIDGDIITLYLNGEIVEQDIHLTRKKRKYVLQLLPGDNYLVMFAENLGEIPPNTCSIIFKNGLRRKKIPLESGLDKSGAVKITRIGS